MIAAQVWEFVVDKYTQSLEDVDELPNGNILITAGGPGSYENAYLVELTATEPSQVAWELHVNNESIYRAKRVDWEALLTLNSQALEEFALSGTITGLYADGLELINSDETLSLSAGATEFEFTQNPAAGPEYNIQLTAEPDNHTDLTHLPVGDPLILQRRSGDDAPDVGKRAGPSDDWTNQDGSWNLIVKPQVEGKNCFASEFGVTLDGQGDRLITGNALPTTTTGTFPIEAGTVVFDYDKNPISLAHTMSK